MMAPAARLFVVMVLALSSCGRIAPAAPPAIPSGAERPVPQALKPGRAVLVEGSSRINGVPGFGRNAFAALSGVYAYQHDAGLPVSVTVFHTTVPLLVAPPWQAAACPGMPAEYKSYNSPSAGSGTTLWLLAGSGFSLIVAMPAEVADPCRFLAVFAERFSFFRRYAERPADISFPATLETGL